MATPGLPFVRQVTNVAAGNAVPRRTFIRLIADAPVTTLIVIVIEHARHRRRIRRGCLSSGRDDYDNGMNHPRGKRQKRINATPRAPPPPTGLETIREHVRVGRLLCQLCNLLALMLENKIGSQWRWSIRFTFVSYRRKNIEFATLHIIIFLSGTLTYSREMSELSWWYSFVKRIVGCLVRTS